MLRHHTEQALALIAGGMGFTPNQQRQ